MEFKPNLRLLKGHILTPYEELTEYVNEYRKDCDTNYYSDKNPYDKKSDFLILSKFLSDVYRPAYQIIAKDIVHKILIATFHEYLQLLIYNEKMSFKETLEKGCKNNLPLPYYNSNIEEHKNYLQDFIKELISLDKTNKDSLKKSFKDNKELYLKIAYSIIKFRLPQKKAVYESTRREINPKKDAKNEDKNVENRFDILGNFVTVKEMLQYTSNAFGVIIRYIQNNNCTLYYPKEIVFPKPFKVNILCTEKEFLVLEKKQLKYTPELLGIDKNEKKSLFEIQKLAQKELGSLKANKKVYSEELSVIQGSNNGIEIKITEIKPKLQELKNETEKNQNQVHVQNSQLLRIIPCISKFFLKEYFFNLLKLFLLEIIYNLII